MGFSPWPAQDGLQRPGISGLGVGTEMAVLRQTRANEPAGGQARCTASDAQTAHHKKQREETRAGGLAAVRAPCWSGLSLRPPQAPPKKRASPGVEFLQRRGIEPATFSAGDQALNC